MDRPQALAAWMQDVVAVFDHSWPGLPPRPSVAVAGADGSTRSADAAAWGRAIAPRLHLVFGMRTYLPIGGGPIAPNTAATWDRVIQKEAEEALGAIAGTHAAGDGTTHIRRQTPGPAIVEVAREVRSPLICVGSTGKGRVEKLLIGSVSESLAHHAPVSTLVARAPPRQGPILVGLSDHPGSLEAALWGAGLALWLDRRLVVAHAAPSDVVLKDFASSGPRAQALRIDWPPRRSLPDLAHSENADLVVVGHGGRPAWLGSTAMAVLRDADTSVLIARPWEAGGGVPP